VSGSLGPMPTGVPGGGLPPGLAAPPGNLGPVTIPQSNPGNLKGAIEKLHAAAQLINDALPQIPIGTPLHTATLKIATDLGKHLGDAQETVQGTIQTMLQAIQQMKQNPQLAGLNQGGAPPPPNQPPAVAPPQAPPMAA
jgi:hypothetical protein